ncbi:MAG: GGDEF domain-containing protein [Blautia marasmi]
MYYQLGLLGFMCALICMTIRQVNEILEGRTGDRILEELAYMDVMTKLGNRSAYEMRLQKLQETMSLGQELSAVMADLNGLKKVNDTLGHKAGDEMIKGCAKCLQEAFCGFGRI